MSSGQNLHLFLQQNLSGVQSFINAHGSVAGHLFARGNRPLDRRGAAILRQQRGMQVDVAMCGQVEHPARNDAPIADDHDALRRNRLKLRAELNVVLDLLRLHDWQPKFAGLLLHRRKRQFHSAPLRTIRLRHHQRHLMTGAHQRLQRRNGKHGSTAINKFHRLDCSGHSKLRGREFLPLALTIRRLIFRRIMSRFSEERWWM